MQSNSRLFTIKKDIQTAFPISPSHQLPHHPNRHRTQHHEIYATSWTIYANINEPKCATHPQYTTPPTIHHTSHTQTQTPINTHQAHPLATSIVTARNALCWKTTEHGVVLCLRMCPSDFYIQYSVAFVRGKSLKNVCVFMSGFRITNISRMWFGPNNNSTAAAAAARGKTIAALSTLNTMQNVRCITSKFNECNVFFFIVQQ